MAERRPGGGSLQELTKRIEAVERLLSTKGAVTSGGAPEEDLHYCALPEVPVRELDADVSPGRARLIRYYDRKWVNGTTLRYYFFPSGDWAGADNQKEMVRDGFRVWEDVGIGIKFQEVTVLSEAEIRIGFKRGDGAWSYVGRDVIDVPGQNERTMNFGWDLTTDRRGVDTPVHEIGHTLGFPHEHQNPFAGIVWDEPAVYTYFSRPPNSWPRDRTFHNVLRKIPEAEVEGSQWDSNSVMHYAFPAGLVTAPEEFRNGIFPELGLSEHDKEVVRKLYPPLDDRYPELKPFQSQRLSLGAGEQKNFSIEPSGTREYRLQTFGGSDTVMVLFEDQSGDLRYVDGDDDSGTDRNASITARLFAGRKYVLRIRLYSQYADGDTAIMLW